METKLKQVNCQQAKNIDIISYLAQIGIEPQRIKGNNYWYFSPLRKERTPSFKINRRINKWYDFGEGCGGDLIDFAIQYHQCTIAEFLATLNDCLSFAKPIISNITKDEPESRIKIMDQRTLRSLPLLTYLKKRSIPIPIADKYCCEVQYSLNEKNYYGIGFKNDKGGFEIRNPYFKTSSSPKYFTHLNNGANACCIFEGFFDFLSFQTLHANLPRASYDFIILNSLSFFELARSIMEKYTTSHLYLDQDNAGQYFTTYALSLHTCYVNESILYKNHKDLNDFHCHFGLNKKMPTDQPDEVKHTTEPKMPKGS